MAAQLPTASTSSSVMAAQRTIKHLIVDSSPLLTSPLSSLRNMATHYLVTPDVVNELRDRKGREVMREAEMQLLPAEGSDAKAGFVIREPSLEAVAKIRAFATRTGDISVLSAADIRVLALCLTLEIEENGHWRVREFPGQVLTGPPPKPEEEGADKLAEKVDELEIKEGEQAAKEEPEPVVEPVAEEKVEEVAAPAPVAEEATASSSAEEKETVATEEEEEGDLSDAESDDSHDSSSSWITPDNVISHKVKDLGLFSPPSAADAAKAPKAILKSAVLTGDFAMQNVALQMGLNVFGSGGKRVREVRTWVLRCHGCFKLCKNPEKRFCPSCGGPTLIRTSITYVTATPENPKGYILHLKSNFQYRLRGTQYSLPSPKMGKAGGVNAAPVLREDQKEWIRGVKTAEVMRNKETRAILKSVIDDKRRGTSNNDGMGGMAGFNDVDWQPAMNKGEKGRKRGGKNGAGGEVRLDSSGMPVIGSGRKNTNESRRRH